MPRTYELGHRLGAGGMGEVLFARELDAGGAVRFVAIKRMHAHLAQDPERRAMFLEEARLAARVHHPNVVATLDVIDDVDSPWLVMDYIDGASLASLLTQLRSNKEPLAPPLAMAIIADVLAGLRAAHEVRDEQGRPMGLIHRDVSPQNIIIGRDGRARVIDFGIARVLDRAFETRTGEVKGKLGYMPPEQLRGKNVTQRVDLYATAAVMWECLTARRFRAGTEGEVVEQILFHELDPPSRFAPGISAALDEAVLRGLTDKPEARYGTAAEMAAALCAVVRPADADEVARLLELTVPDELAAHAELTTRVVASVPARPAAKLRRRPVVVGAIALGATCLVGAAWVVQAGRSRTTAAPVTSLAASDTVAPPTAAPPSLPTVAVLPPAGVTEASTATPSSSVNAKMVSTPRRTPRKPAPPSTTKDLCKVPFEIDDDGMRHYKRECLPRE